MTRPPVSIVLLNFNHGRFLPMALEAMIAALGPEDEIVAFDDASTDNSVDIYRDFANRCPQLRLIAKAQNQGIIACMNEGLAEASHDILYFAASDDRVEATFLDTMATLLGTHPRAGLASCRTRIIDAEGHAHGVLQTPIVLGQPGFLPPENVARAFMVDDNWLVWISTLYRRAPLEEAGGFRPELASFSDGFASRVVSMGHGACYAPEVLTSWRRMEEGYSTSQSMDPSKVLEILENALDLMGGAHSAAFEPGYGARWKGRWLFGARYSAWCRRQEARHPQESASGPAKAMGALTRGVMGVMMFLRYRPRDIWTVIRRRLAYALEEKGGP